MTVVKLQGGLGNQMFQYALGRTLSLSHNTPFKIDSSYLRTANQSGRTYRLSGFTVQAEEATAKEIAAYRAPLQKILDCLRPESKRKKVLEKSAGFNSKILAHTNGYFDGHWNSEKYFSAHEKTIREDFTLKNPLGPVAETAARAIQAATTPVGLHIRRGDYVSIPKVAAVHGTLPLSYYETAMQKITAQFLDAHFFIFSDDIEWAKEHFPKNHPVTFVSAPEIPDYEELTLMSLCKHQIIANSTFSWWAAWLNQNPQKIVIAPKQWFNDPNRGTGGLIPSSWLTL